MESNESVAIRFGGDTSMVKMALNGLGGVAKQALEPVKEAFNETFRGIATAFGVGELIGKIKDVMSSVKQIERVGVSTGLGSEQWQRFAFTLEEVGAESESGEKFLTHLVEKISEANSGVQSSVDVFTKWGLAVDKTTTSLNLMEQIASRLDTLSPGDKSAMIHDFGVKDVDKFVAALETWKKTHGSSASIISDKDIVSLSEANKQLDAMNNRVTVFLGKTAALGERWIGGLAIAVGRWSTGESAQQQTVDALMVRDLKARADALISKNEKTKFTPQNPEFIRAMQEAARVEREAQDGEATGVKRIIALNLEKQAIINSITNAMRGTNEEAKKAMEIAQKDKEIAQAERDLKKETQSAQYGIDSAQRSITDIQRRQHEHLIDTVPGATLEQLAAKSGPWQRFNGLTGGNYSGGPAYALAHQIMDEKQWLLQLRLYSGTQDPRYLPTAQRIRDQEKVLSDAGYTDPDTTAQEMSKSLVNANDHLIELVSLAKGNGLNVNVANSQ